MVSDYFVPLEKINNHCCPVKREAKLMTSQLNRNLVLQQTKKR